MRFQIKKESGLSGDEKTSLSMHELLRILLQNELLVVCADAQDGLIMQNLCTAIKKRRDTIVFTNINAGSKILVTGLTFFFVLVSQQVLTFFLEIRSP